MTFPSIRYEILQTFLQSFPSRMLDASSFIVTSPAPLTRQSTSGIIDNVSSGRIVALKPPRATIVSSDLCLKSFMNSAAKGIDGDQLPTATRSGFRPSTMPISLFIELFTFFPVKNDTLISLSISTSTQTHSKPYISRTLAIYIVDVRGALAVIPGLGA